VIAALTHLSARGWLVLAAAPVFVALLAIAGARYAPEPPYAPLAITGADRQRDATEALDRSGVR